MEPAARFLRDHHHRPDRGGGGAEERTISTHTHHHQQQEEEEEEDDDQDYLLDMFVHEARGIHNICIYGDQDVYAKLTLTSSPDDDARRTRVALGGGAAPRFHERLLPPLRVPRGRVAVDVLKCELWMRACARAGGFLLLDDQLLGFALVPLAAVAADGVVQAAEFELSSTDLIHSPAGTVRLSLALRPGGHGDDEVVVAAAAEGSGGGADPEAAAAAAAVASEVDYSRIEFTDLRVEQENDAMAVQYLPFLRAGDGDDEVVAAEEDCEMSTSPRVENLAATATAAASSDGSTSRNAAAASTTASTVSEDRAVVSSSASTAAEMPPPPPQTAAAVSSRRSPETPTSRLGGEMGMEIDIDMEAEQSAMQRQIMEMYVKSMQQFSESLAKMQLPIDLGIDAAAAAAGGGGGGPNRKEETTDDSSRVIERRQAKKDGARVFYGSRAFF